MRLLGAILAGGQSSRFGSDKAQAMLGGRTLIERAEASIAAHVERSLFVGPGGIADVPRTGLGPLGGLAGALLHAKAEGFDAVLLSACDVPHVPADLLDGLIAARPAYLEAAPVIGCWPVGLAGDLVAFLERENRAVRAWGQRCGATAVPSEAILNINYRQDLLDAEAAGHFR